MLFSIIFIVILLASVISLILGAFKKNKQLIWIGVILGVIFLVTFILTNSMSVSESRHFSSGPIEMNGN